MVVKDMTDAELEAITPEQFQKLPAEEASAFFKWLRGKIDTEGGGMTDEELVASGAIDTTPDDEGEGTLIVKTNGKND